MVYVFLANGFEDMEAITPFDMLQRAGVDVKTVGVGGKNVKSAHGLSVTADIDEKDFDFSDIDAVILPGGMPGAINLKKSALVDKVVKWTLENKKPLCAICAAPGVVLAGTGALSGKKYTCFPGFEVSEGSYTAEKVERDGMLITANGPGSAVKFALAIIEVLCGKKTADSLGKDFC